MKYLSIIGIVVSVLSAFLMAASCNELICRPWNVDPVTGMFPYVANKEFIWFVFIPQDLFLLILSIVCFRNSKKK